VLKNHFGDQILYKNPDHPKNGVIANLIGEKLLISILQDTPLNNTDDTHILHKVASEAIGVLCRGPRSRQKQVLECDAAKVFLR